MDFIQKYLDWLGHIIEAIIMAAVLAFFVLPFVKDYYTAVLVTGLASCQHFFGREKRDYEVHVHMKPPHIKGYIFWKWTWDNATDFWPVVIVYLIYVGWYYEVYELFV